MILGLAKIAVGFVWLPSRGASQRDASAGCFARRSALRCVSKHEGKGIARLILRDGASRLLRMRLPKTRAPRWLVRSLFFPVILQTPISGLPEIGAPMCASRVNPTCVDRSQSVAVPDQRCTASRCTASGTRVIDCRIALPSHQLNQSTLPRSRARIAASGLCLFASLTPVEGWAERRETFGCLRDTRWTRHDAACQAPSEAPCVP
jgi:hypothetical protein